ncbi:MAG: MogA/MoaB family molybdenum cofactor biosynthesis protein [Candidatus Hadarchaeota archaeon]
MTYKKHRAEAPKSLGVGVIVVSDTRSAAMREGQDIDVSGKIIETEAKKMGHKPRRVIIPDEADEIKSAVKKFLNDKKINSIILTGGTGMAKRDVTIETVQPMYDKELPGFGEALRRLGYEQVGTPALLTRASAGLIKQRPVFCLPGAPNAVKTAMKLILPDLAHVAKHARG